MTLGERSEQNTQTLSKAQQATSVTGTAQNLLNMRASSPFMLSIDFAVAILASVMSVVSYHIIAYRELGDVPAFIAVGTLVGGIYCALVRLRERKQPLKISRRLERARTAAFYWTIAFALLLYFLFLLKITDTISRGALLLFYVLGGLAIVTSRVNTPIALSKWRNIAGYAGEVIVIGAGTNPNLNALALEIANGLSAKVTTVLLDVNCSNESWGVTRERFCTEVMNIARSADEGEICISTEGIPIERLHSLLRGLSLIPRSVLLVPNAEVSFYLQQPIVPFGQLLGVEIRRAPLNFVQRAIKRSIDLILASCLSAVLLLPFIIVAIAIKLDSSGPALFRQTRKGFGGKPFRVLKLRTMSVLEDGPQIAQATQGDTRVTRLGTWLRRNSLDELPQLFNVLKGEMSLVGPRPHAIAHDELYSKSIENYQLRQHVKPGMTGWAQVNGLRGPTPTLDLMWRRIEHDLWYAMNASITLDLKILAMTLVEVLRQRNAY